ncbi:MAG TPA: isoprenylcysteine carboxylmethyltransferase family protein [Gemmatimonadaceae bacterium]|nr:isoprenylcysteine carboxylmethyltransferase family protein [Gemmatimonadaceae bacterium]
MLEVRGPNIRVPPAFFVGGFLVGLWLESVKPTHVASGDTTQLLAPIGWTAAALGLALSLSGIASFQSASTPMFPFAPATRLVERGPYRFTRNPMYLGNAISYAGIAIAMNVVWPLLLLPLVMWTVSRFVIREEEKYLLATFGDEYSAYRRRVRRWL